MILKLLRILFIILVIVFLLFLSIVFTAKIVVGSKYFNKAITTGFRGYLNREIKISKIGFNPFSGMNLTGVSVSNYPDFTEGEFFSVDTLSFSFDLPNALEHRSSFGKIAMLSPKLILRKQKDGSLNLNSFSTTVRDSRNSFKRYYAAPAVIFASALSISNGTIKFPSGLAAEKINLSAADISSKQPFDFNTDFILKNISVTAAVRADNTNKTLSFENSNAQVNGKTLNFSGKLSYSSFNDISYDLDVKGDREVLNIVDAIVYGGPQKVNMKIIGQNDTLKLINKK